MKTNKDKTKPQCFPLKDIASNTHLSGKCHKKCLNQFKSDEQAQWKKEMNRFGFFKEMFTFVADDESLKRLVVQHRVFFDAVYSRLQRHIFYYKKNEEMKKKRIFYFELCTLIHIFAIWNGK